MDLFCGDGYLSFFRRCAIPNTKVVRFGMAICLALVGGERFAFSIKNKDYGVWCGVVWLLIKITKKR
jgi:hypothetical protein